MGMQFLSRGLKNSLGQRLDGLAFLDLTSFISSIMVQTAFIFAFLILICFWCVFKIVTVFKWHIVLNSKSRQKVGGSVDGNSEQQSFLLILPLYGHVALGQEETAAATSATLYEPNPYL